MYAASVFPVKKLENKNLCIITLPCDLHSILILDFNELNIKKSLWKITSNNQFYNRGHETKELAVLSMNQTSQIF